MRKYIRFYDFGVCNATGKLIPASGTDSVHYLDGRLNLNSMVNEANDIINRYRFVQNYKYYEIRQGNLSSFKVLYRNFSANRKFKELDD